MGVSKAKIAAMRRRQREVQTGRDFDSELSRYLYLDQDLLADNNIQIYRPKEVNKFVIVDHPKSEDHWAKKIHLHRGIGPNFVDVLCPARHERGRACPLCQLRTELKKQGADDETLRNLSSFTFRTLFYIVDMTDKDTRAMGVQLYPAAKTVEEGIMEQAEDEDGEMIFVADPEKPYLITFRYIEKTGSGYPEYKGIKIREMKNALPAKYLEGLPMLDDLLVNSSDEELESLTASFDTSEVESVESEEELDDSDEDFGDGDFEDDEDDLEPTPKKSKRGSKKQSTKKKKAEPEDDFDDDELEEDENDDVEDDMDDEIDEDFEDDDFDDVAEEKPAAKKKSSTRKKKPVEEDDGEEDFDDLEEIDDTNDLEEEELDNSDDDDFEEDDEEEPEPKKTAKDRLKERVASKKKQTCRTKK